MIDNQKHFERSHCHSGAGKSRRIESHNTLKIRKNPSLAAKTIF